MQVENFAPGAMDRLAPRRYVPSVPLGLDEAVLDWRDAYQVI
jgi:hypothetical protein